MRPLFVYGTLRNRAHLEVVAGGLTGVILRDAALPDHTVRRFGPLVLPALVPAPGLAAPGLVLDGLSVEQRARLDFYEDGYDFTIEALTLSDGTVADVYIPPHGFVPADVPWHPEDWYAASGPLLIEAAHEVMSYKGRLSAKEVASRIGPIRARAAARLRAAAAAPDGTFRGDVAVTERNRTYSQFYALDDLRLTHATFSGGRSAELSRAVFVTADAAILLPYDPVRDRVLLVEQIRMGPLGRGDTNVWHLEPIAGRIDDLETPEDAARREAAEEAGLEVGALHEIARVYASPGNATEFHYIFVGEAELPDDAAGLGGAAEEGEDIKAHILSFDALMDRVRDFRAANAPLVLAALWLAQHRTTLQG